MPKHLTVNDAEDFVASEDVGQASGVAPLDESGRIPAEFIPDSITGAVTSVNGESGDVTLTSADVGALAASSRGAAGGVAPLDGSTKLPVAYLPGVAVQAVNGQTGPSVTLSAADVGALTQAAGDARYVQGSTKGVANGVATLGSDGKVPSAQLPTTTAPVSSVNGKTGAVSLDSTDVGAVPASQKGAASGVATLDASSKIPTAQIPNLPASQINSGTLDTARIPDLSSVYLAASQKGAANGVASLGSDGKVPSAQLPASSGGGAVNSVNTKTGDVVLTASDVGALSTSGGSLTGTVTSTGGSASAVIWAGIVSGDAFDRVRLSADGSLAMGPGNATRDTTMARTAAGEWTMNGKLVLGSDPTTALGVVTRQFGDGRYLLATARGAASGVASLDSGTKVPAAQLPVVPSAITTLTYAATVTTNAALGNRFRLTMTGNATLAAPTNPTDGQMVLWEVTASGAARTLTLATGSGAFAFGTDITALSATASGLTDYIGAIYSSSAARWRVIAYVKGY